MPTIHLTTFIAAPPERVFDLSRSISLRKKAMNRNNEIAVSGTTTGLIKLGETVTWKAKHLFKTRYLKTKVTAMDWPHSFIDEQVRGDFKSMQHEHYFKAANNGTLVIDLFRFEIPYGQVGSIFAKLYLTGYLQNILEQRNKIIKEYAESKKWEFILNK